MSSAVPPPAGRLRAALTQAAAALSAARAPAGHWPGELSRSALSTATAVTALALARRHGAQFPAAGSDPAAAIHAGLHWLAQNQNADGGWGDTTSSLSNLSTTTLGWAAFGATDADEIFAGTVPKAERWIQREVGRVTLCAPPAECEPAAGQGQPVRPDPPLRTPHSTLRVPHASLAAAIIARYGRDRTFSVPILTMCALDGRLGAGRAAWRQVIPLPFELAALPHQFFAVLRLPVVSYALPALIAIGLARHVHAPSRHPFARLIRQAVRKKTLRVLTKIQPSNGGFLEATPLTSFVTMSLAASGEADHPVTRRGLEFLLQSQRADGSWPIDTNLSTWCTTLAMDALPQAAAPNSSAIRDWLLAQQHMAEHPYTHAAPGGWAWTDLPGGVPDADDTSGALLALARMRSAECGVRNEEVSAAAVAGVRWLLGVQNRDGGVPTFCRGWGALPFDRSSADITAHAIRAWAAWREELPRGLQTRVTRAAGRALKFLGRTQRDDGSWTPLWFGNQFEPREENPTYGTARVLRALADIRGPESDSAAARAAGWLVAAQNEDGGWGGCLRGPASVEETALAVEALAWLLVSGANQEILRAPVRDAVARGAAWLVARVESGGWTQPAPIGFYFAKLWYHERLYPMIFTVGALRAAEQALAGRVNEAR